MPYVKKTREHQYVDKGFWHAQIKHLMLLPPKKVIRIKFKHEQVTNKANIGAYIAAEKLGLKGQVSVTREGNTVYIYWRQKKVARP